MRAGRVEGGSSLAGHLMTGHNKWHDKQWRYDLYDLQRDVCKHIHGLQCTTGIETSGFAPGFISH